MLKFLEYLNEKTNNTYKDIKLVGVIYDNEIDNIILKFLYNTDSFTDEDKETIKKCFIEYIPFDYDRVVVKAKKSYIDSKIVQSEVYKYMITYYKTLNSVFSIDNVLTQGDEKEMVIKISLPKFHYDFLKSKDFENELYEYLNLIFFGNFTIHLISLDVESNFENILIASAEQMQEDLGHMDYEPVEIKYNKVTNIQKFLGRNEINGHPMQLKSIDRPYEVLEIAGKISFFTEKSFVKNKDEKGNEVKRIYYSFMLSDDSGKFNCVYFPTKTDADKAKQLADGDEVILTGSVEEFNGRLNYKVMAVSMCKLIHEEKPKEIEKPVETKVEYVKEPKDKYYYVQPEKYVDFSQSDMFGSGEEISEYLMTHDVVMFDLETTGLDATKNQIIEIGAVKIHKGKIYETFEVLVRPDPLNKNDKKSKDEPDIYIPDEIVNITHITDDMVRDCPTIDKVLPDFYKFTYGCTLMAYNIDFDYRFLSYAGLKLGYVFDNKQIDALLLARQHVVGAKNFKLGNICKMLGISLENAHRAVHDAVAAAEVVIKLNKYLAEYDPS